MDWRVVNIVFLNSVMRIFPHASLSEIRVHLTINVIFNVFLFAKENLYSLFRRNYINKIRNILYMKTLKIETTSQK